MNDILFVIISEGYCGVKGFMVNVRKVIEYGLSKEMVFKVLMSMFVEMIGVFDKVGVLKKGMLVNFLIINGEIFDEKMIIYENWI